MVNRRPIRDHGFNHLRKMLSYRFGPKMYRSESRVMMAVPRGIPKKTATLVATVEYETLISEPEYPITLINNMASGA